jgi:hypothetical protein
VRMYPALSVVGAVAYCCAFAMGGTPLIRMGSGVDIRSPDLLVVVAKCTRASLPQAEAGSQIRLPAVVRYDATVSYELCGRVHPEATIEIEGQRGVQGSSPREIPRLEEGQLFVMAVTRREKQGRYEYAGPVRLAIGVSSPDVVDEDEVKQLFAAMEALDAALKEGITRQRSRELMGSENFYLWALGVSGLASFGEREDREELMRFVMGGKGTPRQVLWVDQILGADFPEGQRLSPTQSHRLLLEYLRRRMATETTKGEP